MWLAAFASETSASGQTKPINTKGTTTTDSAPFLFPPPSLSCIRPSASLFTPGYPRISQDISQDISQSFLFFASFFVTLQPQHLSTLENRFKSHCWSAPKRKQSPRHLLGRLDSPTTTPQSCHCGDLRSSTRAFLPLGLHANVAQPKQAPLLLHHHKRVLLFASAAGCQSASFYSPSEHFLFCWPGCKLAPAPPLLISKHCITEALPGLGAHLATLTLHLSLASLSSIANSLLFSRRPSVLHVYARYLHVPPR